MDRARPLPNRRRVLKGAALAAIPYALLPTPRADAKEPVDHPSAHWSTAASANYTAADRPVTHPVDFVIIHVTQASYRTTLSVFRNPRKHVSAHYLVYEDGCIDQLVPEARRAWHAGVSSWRSETDINSRSIGIEIVNPGHEFGYRDFPEAQIEAVIMHPAIRTGGVEPDVRTKVAEHEGLAKQARPQVRHDEPQLWIVQRDTVQVERVRVLKVEGRGQAELVANSNTQRSAVHEHERRRPRRVNDIEQRQCRIAMNRVAVHRREQANAAQASTIERALKPGDGVRRQGVQHRVAVEAIGKRGHRLL